MEIPYFNHILKKIYEGDELYKDLFGKHVHWGYWHNHKNADITIKGCKEALDNLSLKLIEEANIKDGNSVADIGCGLGGTTILLNKNYKDLKVSCVNIDEKQLQFAKENISNFNEGSSQISYYVQDASLLKLPEPQDAILAVECIFHFPDIESFLQKAHKNLQNGGRLVFCDFIMPEDSYFLLTLYSLPYLRKIKRLFGQISRSRSIDFYKDLAQKSNFKIVKVQDITDQTYSTYDMYDKYLEHFGEIKEDFYAVNKLFRKLFKKRLLTYQIVTLEK